MFLQIVIVALLIAVKEVVPQNPQHRQLENPKNYPGETKLRQEKDILNLPHIVFSSSPLFHYSNDLLEKDQEETQPGNQAPLFGKGSKQRRRRDVPSSSYSRSGADGVSVYVPTGDSEQPEDSQTTSNPEEVTTLEDGSSTENSPTDNGISSTTSSYQKPALKKTDQKPFTTEEPGQAMQGQYSFTALDGSTFNTTWTANEKGLHVKVPQISIFGLGFGRRR